ncbi:MAG: methyltransferase [Chloroflexi bacterium]|jgi:methylated-DNA-protein-cysteine methyltransferase related protein|nr:methyltransferase [Chloroflexota bacterium]
MSAQYLNPATKAKFQQQVWALVRRIPAGRVMTYGQIAEMLDPPDGMNIQSYLAFGARWVGGAMAACPEDIPWQRVINAKGMVSARAGAQIQRELLQAEGVIFDARGRVDLSRYRWSGE